MPDINIYIYIYIYVYIWELPNNWGGSTGLKCGFSRWELPRRLRHRRRPDWAGWGFGGVGCGATELVGNSGRTNRGLLLAAPGLSWAAPGLLVAAPGCMGCSWLPWAAPGCPGLLRRLPPHTALPQDLFRRGRHPGDWRRTTGLKVWLYFEAPLD